MHMIPFPEYDETKRSFAGALAAVLALALPVVSAAGLSAEAEFAEAAGRTLFAFDQVSIPFSENLRLEMRSPERHPANPVLPRGDSGAPDSWAVQFYGSVIREGGKFRMWYIAAGDERAEGTGPRSAPWRPAYAESDDGIHWTKPNLGLVEYRGNKNNNLILTEPAPLGILNLKVLSEPADPNPEHRYKISAHVWFSKGKSRFGTLAPFFSADGLRWKMVVDAHPVAAELTEKDMVLPPIHFEPAGGLYKWDGIYYASGQNANTAARPYHGRVVRMYHSGDFVDWSHTSAVGFVRTAQHTLLGAGRSREGEQTHEGISVWNRGNVLLGLYGIWHGAKDWKDVAIDLGFVFSNDGINFREPAHEWTFLRRGEDGVWDQGGLLQGQGFENVGDQTYIYYGTWDPRDWEGSPPRGGVGLATLPRDRFGDLVVDEAGKGAGDYQMPVIQSEFITAAIPTKASVAHRFYLNADGLCADAALKIHLMDASLRPLPGYSGQAAAVVRQSGFHTPISWNGQMAVVGLPDRIRLKVSFDGDQKTKIRFSALYVQDETTTR